MPLAQQLLDAARAVEMDGAPPSAVTMTLAALRLQRLEEVMASAERSLNITRDNLIEDSGHPDLEERDLRHFAGQVESVAHAIRSALAKSST